MRRNISIEKVTEGENTVVIRITQTHFYETFSKKGGRAYRFPASNGVIMMSIPDESPQCRQGLGTIRFNVWGEQPTDPHLYSVVIDKAVFDKVMEAVKEYNDFHEEKPMVIYSSGNVKRVGTPEINRTEEE